MKNSIEIACLKNYLKEHFDFSALKKIGVFSKEMKCTDYEGQAKRICALFGYESVYEYSKHEIRCHISYAEDRTIEVNKDGQLSTTPFVEVVFPNQLHI